ncbi:protein disulfide-isomerase TMX3-like [Diadema antillarum]|uniref:protein disulfide-isomerase TMX3-like n=1 Tax=Diadema antillarum TaxID=105358 RepID=UPI003A859C34
MMLSQVLAVIGLFLVPVDFVRGNVIELDDRFLDIKNQGKWLVEFYAPWCGHCQKLKPVWADVGLQLMKTHPRLHVARLDGTRFSRVMDAYDVRGFPSIKYIEGDKVFTHNGGRTSQDIIDFALKAQGPAVKQLTSASSLEQFRAKKDVFFAFIAEDMSSEFAKTFSEVADKRILDAFYYHIQPNVLPDKLRPEETPALLVFKDDKFYQYSVPAGGVSESDLSNWIGSEMFPAFLRIGNDNINPIGRTEKLIAVGLVYPSANVYKSHPHSIMLDKLRDVAIDYRDTYQKRVQFGYMEDSNLLSDIILRSVEVPGIFVIDPVTYLYYELENPLEQTEESLVSFINSIIEGTAEAKGGNSFLRKIYRVFYEIVKSIVMMWLGQPILMTLLIALPTILISFICYSICTAEPIDEDADIRDSEDEEEDDDPNEADKDGKMIEEVGETNPSGHQKTE